MNGVVVQDQLLDLVQVFEWGQAGDVVVAFY